MPWKPQTITIPYHHALPALAAPRFSGMVQTDHPLTLSAGLVHSAPKELLREAQGSVALIPACPLPGPVEPLAWIDGYLRYIPSVYPHYYHVFCPDFATFLRDHASKSRRKKYRKIIRLFEEEFGAPLAWHLYNSPEEFEAFYPLARQISQRTYQSLRLGLGLPEDAASVARWRALAEEGELLGALLFAREVPVAFVLACVVDGHILRLDYGGYDPDYREWSPGTLLDYLIFERLYKAPLPKVDIVDLTEGEGFHKSAYATKEVRSGDVYFFRPTPINLGFVMSHRSALWGYQACRAWLKQRGLDERARRFVRGERGKA